MPNLNASEVADRLGVTTSYFYTMINEGKFPPNDVPLSADEQGPRKKHGYWSSETVDKFKANWAKSSTGGRPRTNSNSRPARMIAPVQQTTQVPMKLDSGYYTEALYGVTMVQELFNNISSHPVVKSHSDLQGIAKAAEAMLGVLYQNISIKADAE